jgi:hypothetical protein
MFDLGADLSSLTFFPLKSVSYQPEPLSLNPDEDINFFIPPFLQD